MHFKQYEAGAILLLVILYLICFIIPIITFFLQPYTDTKDIYTQGRELATTKYTHIQSSLQKTWLPLTTNKQLHFTELQQTWLLENFWSIPSFYKWQLILYLYFVLQVEITHALAFTDITLWYDVEHTVCLLLHYCLYKVPYRTLRALRR